MQSLDLAVLSPYWPLLAQSVQAGIAGGVLYRLRGWGYWDQNICEGRLTWAGGFALLTISLTSNWLVSTLAFIGSWIGLLRPHGRYFGMYHPVRDIPAMALIGLYQAAWAAGPFYLVSHDAALIILLSGPLMGVAYWLGAKLPREMVKDHIVYSEVIAGFVIFFCVTLAVGLTKITL